MGQEVGGSRPSGVGTEAISSTCLALCGEQEDLPRDGGSLQLGEGQEIAGKGLAQWLSQDRPGQLQTWPTAWVELQEPGLGGGSLHGTRGLPLCSGAQTHTDTHAHARVEAGGLTPGHTGLDAEQRLLRACVCARVRVLSLWGGDRMEFGNWPG